MAYAIHPRSRSISPASSIASSHASTTTSNGSAIEWDMIKQGNLVEISDFIKTGLPINKATATSNDKIYCTFCPIEEEMHKMKRQYRACYEDNDEDDDKSCGVKYRVDSCETKNFGKIYQNDKIHTHKVDESYNYVIGINEKVKTAINKILEFNPQQKHFKNSYLFIYVK